MCTWLVGSLGGRILLWGGPRLEVAGAAWRAWVSRKHGPISSSRPRFQKGPGPWEGMSAGLHLLKRIIEGAWAPCYSRRSNSENFLSH